MPKTVQIRDLDDDVYAALARRAAADSISVPELLRREAARLAARPTMSEWLAEARRPQRSSVITRKDVIETLDELRGPWPHVGH